MDNSRAEGSLFNTNRVLSQQISLFENPKSVYDYEEITNLLSQIPLAKELVREGFPIKALPNLLNCGKYTGSVLKTTCECGYNLLALKNHCSNRSCPSCSKRRRKKINKRVMPQLMKLKQDNLNSFKLLTISPKNTDTLQKSYDYRKSLINSLRKNYFQERIICGVYVFEDKSRNKYGIPKGWNGHFHILYYGRRLNNYVYGYCKNCKKKVHLNKDELNKVYHCSNKKCNYIINSEVDDSRLVKELKKTFKVDLTADIKDLYVRGRSQFKHINHSLNYILKYISINKNDFASENDFAKHIVFTRRKRLITFFGSQLKKIKIKYEKEVCLFCDCVFSYEIYSSYRIADIPYKPPDKRDCFDNFLINFNNGVKNSMLNAS